jgi:hypothetical protein
MAPQAAAATMNLERYKRMRKTLAIIAVLIAGGLEITLLDTVQQASAAMN